MLTLFATLSHPKTLPQSFLRHIAITQRNAIRSWTLLQPACEIILFGDDEGTAEITSEFRLHHIPRVACTESGKPFLNLIFEQAQELATHDILCYVNADIILLNNFMHASEQVIRRYDRFLMAGQRWDIDINESLDFGSNWEEKLCSHLTEHGELQEYQAIDYFVFSRGILGEIPPFILGLTAWDNWLIYKARSQGIPVIDATRVVTVIHQNHEYSYFKGDTRAAHADQEAMKNLQLAGGSDYLFDLRDATHLITKNGLHQALENEYLLQRLRRHAVLTPSTRVLSRIHRRLLREMGALIKHFPWKGPRKLLYNLSK